MKRPVSPVEAFEDMANLMGDIRPQLRLLLHEVIQLAKSEMSEKVSRLKRNVLLVVAGAISVYTATMFLLIGVAGLIALGLRTAGLSPLLSVGLGAIAVFIMVGATGYMLLQKGMSALGESLMPEKTLQTLGLTLNHDSERAVKDLRSSAEWRDQVEKRQALLGQDLGELKVRVRTQGVFLADQSRRHPFRFLWMSTAVTMAAFQLVKRLFKSPGP